jgi:hypothetical protein
MSPLRRVATGLAVALTAALAPGAAQAAPPASCPNPGPATAGVTTTQVFTGSFSRALAGSYVMVPFDVPAGTTQVRVRYCWDKPENNTAVSHTLDLGIYEPLKAGDTVWGVPEFRGWGGSSHPDVALSDQGFSTQAQYLAAPKAYIPGRTTRGFEPGPIPAGRWAAELGVAAVLPPPDDATGEVGWRVEVELSNAAAYADAATAYAKAPYDSTPARTGAGWYAGDFHVHSEHSALGNAPISQILDYAFGPAGLDFTALSDYVTDSAWGEIGRYQPQHPGKLVIPSSEVVTYHGHLGNQASGRVVDYRTGPIEEYTGGTATDAVTPLRAARPPSTIFDQIHAGGGFTIINHPRIFPPTSAALEAFCRGCYWNYSDADTDFSKVDGIELFNSAEDIAGVNAPNPFNADAVTYWQHAMSLGHRIAAVGGSDDHQGGAGSGPTYAPVGTPATMVYADELSVAGIERGVKAGHTYVKPLGVTGPSLSLTAKDQAPGGAGPVMMGDAITGSAVRISAQAAGARFDKGQVLELQRDGTTVASATLTGPTASLTYDATQSGRYNLVVERASHVIEALSSPIYVTVGPATPPVLAELKLKVTGLPGNAAATHSGRLGVTVINRGGTLVGLRARLRLQHGPVVARTAGAVRLPASRAARLNLELAGRPPLASGRYVLVLRARDTGGQRGRLRMVVQLK